MQTFSFRSDTIDDGTGKKIKMVFTGYLTLQNATEIKRALQKQTEEFKSIELQAKDVSGIDVSFLQIIESYRKTFQEEGKQVRILFDLPYDLKTLLSNAGISYPVK